ncbi:hypothetical protein GCM10011399_11270 [Subtercola lobariae]|uniref:Uncharacterized protein n=1 Tax=Subtercola lobariae TaxID=1588641 RepID=A0A917EVV2_9MICO|nr:hypothetical protein GCM10011399_11270 [Subtercola lobariae]
MGRAAHAQGWIVFMATQTDWHDRGVGIECRAEHGGDGHELVEGDPPMACLNAAQRECRMMAAGG